MKITPALLRKHGACSEQVEEFAALYPHGTEPTVEEMFTCAAEGLDVLWCLRLLPLEGPGSQRAFSLWCAEQVAHLSDDPRVAECLAVVRTRVLDPASVTDNVLAAAWAAAREAAAWAAEAAAWAAREAEAALAAQTSWEAEAALAAQIAMLSQMLLEARDDSWLTMGQR